jgi:hypothetical protein
MTETTIVVKNRIPWFQFNSTTKVSNGFRSSSQLIECQPTTVVAAGILKEVYEGAIKLAANEEKVRNEILAGATVEELLSKFGRI